MRFLCLYRPGTTENDNPPTQDEIERMGKLIQEMSQAGVLLATEGCRSSKHGARVRVGEGGGYRVTDGPFPETKELIAGMCLLQVKTKAEAIEWSKRFLAVVGEGETEIRLLNDAPGA